MNEALKTQDKMINVVFCTDSNYVMPCGIAIASLLENNKDLKIKIFIVGLSLTEKDNSSFSTISEKYNREIEILPIDKSFLDKYDLPLSGIASSKYITLASYVRLFLSTILPSNIDKILYLDCDLFVVDKVKELYETHLDENVSLAGVMDQHMFDLSIKEYYERLKYSDKLPYINAGVLLINLKYWRENDVLQQFMDYIKSNRGGIKYHDQDVINGTLNDSFYLLPLRYNLQSQLYQRNTIKRIKKQFNSYYKELVDSLSNPVIIHFTTFYTKPWFKGSLHPMSIEYDKYSNLTEWKGTPKKWAKDTFSIKFKYYKRKFLQLSHIKKSKYISIGENLDVN